MNNGALKHSPALRQRERERVRERPNIPKVTNMKNMPFVLIFKKPDVMVCTKVSALNDRQCLLHDPF